MRTSVLVAVLLLACTEPPLKPPPVPPPPTEGDACARACQRLEQLGCPEAEPEAGLDGKKGTADDVPCLEWMCAADYLDHEAIARANSCSEVQ